MSGNEHLIDRCVYPKSRHTDEWINKVQCIRMKNLWNQLYCDYYNHRAVCEIARFLNLPETKSLRAIMTKLVIANKISYVDMDNDMKDQLVDMINTLFSTKSRLNGQEILRNSLPSSDSNNECDLDLC